MNNHSARPTSFLAVPEAHANVAEIPRNRKRGCGKEKWKGKRDAMFKGKGKGRPWGKSEPKKVKGETSEQRDRCCRCGGTGHRSRNCHAPKHLVELYQGVSTSKDMESPHKSHFTTEPKV